MFKRQTLNDVELLLENSSGERIKLTGLSVPVICSPLSSAVNVDYSHLEGLGLADPVNKGEFRSRPISALFTFWPLSQSECVNRGFCKHT